ncbi:Signal recognition particle receptor FtsY [Methanimicrococcus hongohii]|uniref:Signal recognition particle receptor FtsY n=1 Tax=Methanimicrococcus hongohii TaxID=3028295 RepID=A0AA96V7J9_9EURY|nr:signal recognition particle-docking protein FtsY [Methanimicrococcus sp. Hf6]WNY22966.1 Signal recognition particle receptor FtsY [Methanimicrococcus sp. Hf6]
MFGKLKEKLASFTKSLDKTVEEKAVALEEPEVVVEEKIIIETDAENGLNAAEVEIAAEIIAENLEEKEIESIQAVESDETAGSDIEVGIGGTIEKDELPSSDSFSESSLDSSSESSLDSSSESSLDSSSESSLDFSSESSPDSFSSDSKASAQSESKKEKAGFFGKAKALIFDREVILDDNDLEGPLMELEIALLESDLALSVTDAIVESVREQLSGTRKRLGKNTGSIVEDALKNAILEVMSANVFDFDEFLEQRRGQTVHIAFVGINGTGKTTSIAKIGNRLQKNGYSVTIAAGDTFRAGAIDQIQIHADRLGIKVIKHQEGSDPAAVIYDALQYAKAHKSDVLLSDTAGRMHTNVNLMAQLEKICRVSTPDLIIFVDEATAGNDAVERASQFNDAVPISGTILTKLDADSKGGAAISIAYITQKPILFFGVGQEYDDLLKFDPEWFVDKIFED